MPSIFVASYSIRVKPRGSKSFSELGFAQGQSVLQVVTAALTAMKTAQRNAATQHVTRVTQLHANRTDTWGVVERGDYGYEASGINSITFKRTFTRDAKDAEMIPLYFRFHLPAESNRGILLIQRLGIHGAFTELKAAVMARFIASFPKHTLEFGRFVPESIMRALLEGAVREMSVITHSMPKDIADHVRLKGTETQVGKVEVRIAAPRQKLLFLAQPSWLKKLRANEAEIVELFGDDAESVRVWVDYNGRERMYDFKRQDSSAPYVDITNEVKTSRSGHPVFSSIDEYCRNLRDELITQTGGEVS